jgi:hypothetical protein
MNAVNKFLLDYNCQQSSFFLSPDQVARRELYRAHHPTEVMVNKCMDGRVNVPKMTDDEVPMGIIAPFRNMGGRFKIGSTNYAPHVRNFYEHTLRAMKERKCPGGIVIVTYHYSAGDTHRGCKGFGYDTDAARAYTANLMQDYRRVFGDGHEVVYPVQMGVETDKEAFVFHGEAPGTTLDITEALDWPIEKLRAQMRKLYPSMRPAVFDDFMPFAVGNQRHVRKVVETNRPPERLDHAEQVIGVGRGFDWLHLVNKALIVGPFSLEWVNEVVIAANIVLSNFKENRIPREEGAVLLVSAPYRDHGVDAAVAREKAVELARIAWEAVSTKVPELLEYDLELVVGTLDRTTMKFERIERAARPVSDVQPRRESLAA